MQKILFDLDGTLTDPATGITNSVFYALSQMGYELPARESLLDWIGPPLAESFRNRFGMNESQIERAVSLYREYFSERGLYENELYSGVDHMLRRLKDLGRQIYLATSKPEIFARRILEHFGIDQSFDFIGGATLDHERNEKADVIRYVLQRTRSLPQDCVMVGDRKHDIYGAHQCKIPTIGVTYGYGNRSELTSAGAEYIVESIAELTEFLSTPMTSDL